MFTLKKCKFNPVWSYGPVVFYLINGEHVEMCDVMFLGVSDPGSALFLIDKLPHVLVHKLPLYYTQQPGIFNTPQDALHKLQNNAYTE